MSWQNYLIKNFMRIGVKSKWESTTVDSGRETLNTYVDQYMPKPPRQIAITQIVQKKFKGERLDKKKTAIAQTILYLHGGVFMSASPETHRGITCGLAMENAGSVWALDYPLAPEHAIEEIIAACVAAYDYLIDSGIHHGSIAVAGDQAGAWLATKLVIQLRDTGKPLPAALILLCPFLDTTLSGDSFTGNKDADPISDHNVAVTMVDMVFKGKDLSAPEWCLLHADLSDFPPVLIQSSDIDILSDDANRMARALEKGGCKVRHEVWKKVPPIWHLFWWAMPEAKSAIKSAAKFISDQLEDEAICDTSSRH